MISIKTNREVVFLPRVCGLVLSFGNICDHLKINQTKMYKNNLGFYQDMTIIFHHHPWMLCCTPFSFMEEAIFLDINNFERTCDVIQSSQSTGFVLCTGCSILIVRKFLLLAPKIWVPVIFWAYWGLTSYGPFDKICVKIFCLPFGGLYMVSP